MKLQARHAVAKIDQARARVGADDLIGLAQQRQADGFGRRGHGQEMFLRHVEVEPPDIAPLVKGSLAGREQFAHKPGHFAAFLLQASGGFAHAQRVPRLEGAEFIVVAPFHRVIDGHDVVGNFRDAVGRVADESAEVLPGKLAGLVAGGAE